jgi:hypothetical protein
VGTAEVGVAAGAFTSTVHSERISRSPLFVNVTRRRYSSVRPALPGIDFASNSTESGGLTVALTDCGPALAEIG